MESELLRPFFLKSKINWLKKIGSMFLIQNGGIRK